jgi:hypothetical protein
MSDPFEDMADIDTGSETNGEASDTDDSHDDSPAEAGAEVGTSTETGVESETETGTDAASDTEPPTASVTHSSQSQPASTDGGGAQSQPQAQSSTAPRPRLSESQPQFDHKAADQEAFYLRDGLGDEFDDLKFEAERHIRSEHDVRNIEVREMDTAIIQALINHITLQDIAAEFIRNRGFDPENVD